jgi:outer membrane lipoprotein-sorting protein
MRYKILNTLILVLLTAVASAQVDPQAVKILDSFAAKATSAPSVSMKFDMVTVNQAELTADTLQGSVILSKDKYRLDLPDNIVFFNGESSWSYLPAEKEVTVTKADKKDNSFQNRPSAIFSMYKNGYKIRLIEERTSAWVIDLYPEDIKNEIIRIRLTIGKIKLNLMNLEYKRRDGVIIDLKVKDYDLTRKPTPDAFIFDTAKYKGVEVIDMR